MHCCERECKTKFCPYCGKANESGPGIYGLLAHCRLKQSMAEKEHLKAKKSVESKEEPTEYYGKKWLTNSKRNVDKWTRWADELSELLKDKKKE